MSRWLTSKRFSIASVFIAWLAICLAGPFIMRRTTMSEFAKTAEDARRLTAAAENNNETRLPSLLAEARIQITQAANVGERHVTLFYHGRLEAVSMVRELQGFGFTAVMGPEPYQSASTLADRLASVCLTSSMFSVGVSW